MKLNIFKFLLYALFTKHKENKFKYILEEQSLLDAERCTKLMEEGRLSIIEARWYLHVLPTHYHKHGYYAESVHTICNECHKRLWEYCLKKGFIDDISYEEFTEHGMIHFRLEDSNRRLRDF